MADRLMLLLRLTKLVLRNTAFFVSHTVFVPNAYDNVLKTDCLCELWAALHIRLADFECEAYWTSIIGRN